MKIDFILNSIHSFQGIYPDGTVIVTISADAYDSLTVDEKIKLDAYSTLYVVSNERLEQAAIRLMGVIKEHLLLVGIDVSLEVEEAIRNTSTGIHNFRLLY